MSRRVALVCLGVAVWAAVTPALAMASQAPTWGPVKATGLKARVLTDASRVNLTFGTKGKADAINEDLAISIRVPSSSATVRVAKVLTTEHPLINGGKRFPLARVVATTKFTLLQRGYTEKIFSSNFDRYWNVCVNEAKSVTAEGGDVYCTVWHPERVRMVRSAKIQNYPRPVVISETDMGPANPKCSPGASKTTNVDGRNTKTEECRDGVSTSGADYSDAKRNLRVVARIYNGRTWVESTTDAVVPGSGPDWVEVSRQALAAPTATVSTFVQLTASSWRATGTLSCSYIGTFACPYKLWFKRTDGTWGATYDYEFLIGLPAGPFANHPFDETVYVFSGAPPNGEVAYSDTRPGG